MKKFIIVFIVVFLLTFAVPFASLTNKNISNKKAQSKSNELVTIIHNNN